MLREFVEDAIGMGAGALLAGAIAYNLGVPLDLSIGVGLVAFVILWAIRASLV